MSHPEGAPAPTATSIAPNAYRDAAFTRNAYEGVIPMGSTPEYTAPGTVFTGEQGALVPYAPASTELAQQGQGHKELVPQGHKFHQGHKVIDHNPNEPAYQHESAEAALDEQIRDMQARADQMEAERLASEPVRKHKANLSDMTPDELDTYLKDTTGATDDQIRRSKMTPEEIRMEQAKKALKDNLYRSSEFGPEGAAEGIREREARLAEGRTDVESAVRRARGFKDKKDEKDPKATDLPARDTGKKPEDAPEDADSLDKIHEEMQSELNEAGFDLSPEYRKAEELYTRAAARRQPSLITRKGNGRFDSSRWDGSSQKGVEATRQELNAQRALARTEMSTLLAGMGYDTAQINQFLKDRDHRAKIATSARIRDIRVNVANGTYDPHMMKNMKPASPREKLVNKVFNAAKRARTHHDKLVEHFNNTMDHTFAMGTGEISRRVDREVAWRRGRYVGALILAGLSTYAGIKLGTGGAHHGAEGSTPIRQTHDTRHPGVNKPQPQGGGSGAKPHGPNVNPNDYVWTDEANQYGAANASTQLFEQIATKTQEGYNVHGWVELADGSRHVVNSKNFADFQGADVVRYGLNSITKGNKVVARTQGAMFNLLNTPHATQARILAGNAARVARQLAGRGTRAV